MTEIAVVLHSETGRTLRLAQALAEGAASVPGTRVHLARVATPVQSGSDNGAVHDLPVARPAELAKADGIALGAPVHLGAPSAAMMGFLAETAGLWQQGSLTGRVATVLAGAGSGGGSEAALATLWSVLASHGMLILPGSPRAAHPGGGGSPLGAVALAGSDPDGVKAELDRARAQGVSLARVAQAVRALR